MNETKKIILGRTKLRRASSHRISLTMDHIYGNITGTGQVDAILTEIVQDLRAYCRLTGKDFNKLIKRGLVPKGAIAVGPFRELTK